MIKDSGLDITVPNGRNTMHPILAKIHATQEQSAQLLALLEPIADQLDTSVAVLQLNRSVEFWVSTRHDLQVLLGLAPGVWRKEPGIGCLRYLNSVGELNLAIEAHADALPSTCRVKYVEETRTTTRAVVECGEAVGV